MTDRARGWVERRRKAGWLHEPRSRIKKEKQIDPREG